MATFNPDRGLLREQIESLRAQTGVEWHCFVSDDCSDDGKFEGLTEEIAGDERFTVSRSPRRLGFYRNFERAMDMVPDEYPLVALSDQDDRWYPEKLATLAEALGDAMLVYSDQRLVTVDGQVIADTYWGERRNNFTDLASMLFANSVTGAASLFPRSLLDTALPFPELPGEQYHDQWLALVALTLGDIHYVDRPLYDYVQHGGAVLGHEAANAGLMSAGWRRLDPRTWRGIIAGWGSAYFDVFLRLKAIASILLDRCAGRMKPKKQRVLERFLGSERSLSGLLWIGMRPMRKYLGRNETLGSERVIARGIVWRHLAAVRRRLPDRISRTVDEATALKPEKSVTDQMRRKVAPLVTVVDEAEPRRINLLIPTIDLEHLFGGYIAKFNLARRLAETGVTVRIVTVDPTPHLPDDWRERVEAFNGLADLFDEVEISFGRDGSEMLRINPDDRFIATTWWTAHIADRLVAQTGGERFLYLIQEYEPITVPEGAWRELAEESYGFDHAALFSTEFLENYFRSRRIGVFADEAGADLPVSLTFRNAITEVPAPDETELGQRRPPRLLFYARPEAHAGRNLYELGVEALKAAVAAGVFPEDWVIAGIGSTGETRQVDLGRGFRLEVQPRTGQDAYANFLAGNDVGMALMDAPHPSLVPIEMASAGMLTVTTTYEGRTREAMAAISSNLIAVAPDVDSLVAGLAEAVGRAGSAAERVAGARVDWSRDWQSAFSDEVLALACSALSFE